MTAVCAPTPARARFQDSDAPRGLLFVGEKGKMLTGYYGGKARLLPEKTFRDFQPPPKTLLRSVGHYKEWLQACKGGKPAN